MTQSQIHTQAIDVDEEELQRLAQECSLFLLNRHTTNLPIKRTDIMNSLMKDRSRKTQTEVLKRAQNVLRRVHGLSMFELNDKQKTYLLINEVPPIDGVQMNWDEAEKKKMILLFLVLSVIYMSGDSLSERALMAFLRKLRIITMDSFISPYFGDVGRMLRTDFVQERYVVYESVRVDQDSEDITFVLHWGVRAKREVNKEHVLEYVCQVLECDMSEFTEQFANMTAA